MKILQALTLVLATIPFALPAFMPPQKPTKEGTLNVLPAELRLEQVKAIASPPLPLKQAIANIKQYYLSHPPSRQSVGMTQAILTHLMNEYHLDANELQSIVDRLAKRETMIVFQNNEMKQWIDAQKERLNKNKDLIFAVQKIDTKEVEDLLAHGAQANAYHRALESPLSNAFYNYFDSIDEHKKADAFKIIELLVNAGANSITLQGATPLSRAIFAHSIPIVTLLLNTGTNPNFYSGIQPSPLAGATYFLLDALHNRPNTQEISERKVVLKLLLEAGANPNASGKFLHNINYANIRDLISSLEVFTPEGKEYFTPEEKAEVIEIIYGEQK